MSKVGEWIEIGDDRIMEVEEETEATYIGREIIHKGFCRVKYGNRITVTKKSVLEEVTV